MKGDSSSPSLSSSLILFILSLSLLYFLSSSEPTPFRDVNMKNRDLHFVQSSHANSCERVRVTSISRLNLKSYASSFHVSLDASEAIPERFNGKIEVCLHRNVSLGLCQCDKDEWHLLQNGLWSVALSPYENRYIDVKFNSKVPVPVTVSLKEEFQQWRLLCLGFGFLLLLFAPIISNWVPFYYSSSMALGVLLVVLIILFQGMKLLPMGRKNIIYLTIYGSALGIGSYIVHYFSTAVNSIMVNFGMSEEMHNPVLVFLLAGTILAGAALGYWVVRKFVLSEDGSVDAGIAQFVKWSMRVIAIIFFFQSTFDGILAMVALGSCWCTCSIITSRKWGSPVITSGKKNIVGRTVPSRAARGWSNSPIKGVVYSSPEMESSREHKEYYSTFHKMPKARKFSKKEWEDFTRESTREALDESSGSSEETSVEDGSVLSCLKWY